MDNHLKACAGLAVVMNSVHSTPVREFTMTYNSVSGNSHILFWNKLAPALMCTYTYPHKDTDSNTYT